MNTRLKRNFLLLFALTAGLVLVPGLALAESAEPVTIEGEVEVAEEDDDGNVTAVYVFDEVEGACLVDGKGKGRELTAHVGKSVRLTGTLSESDDADFDWVITVTSVTILEADEE